MSKTEKEAHYFEIDIPDLKEKIDTSDIIPSEGEKDISFLELIFPNFQIKSFTFILCSLQLIVYIITYLYWSVSNLSWECVLYNFGAGFEPDVRHNYSIHRLILMPIFLHYNFQHIALNILGQAMILFHLEASYPRYVVIAIYFFSNLGGSILSSMVYSMDIKVGCSIAFCGCLAFELLNLINKNEQVIYKSKVRFGCFCLFFGVITLPILRVYDNKSKIKNHRLLKMFIFYGFIILYSVMYVILSVINDINTEKVNEKPPKDENFHWLRQLLENSEQESHIVIDNIGHFGGFMTGFMLSLYFYKKENESIWFSYIKRFSLFLGCVYLACGTMGCFIYDVPKVYFPKCEI